ncbi:MAG TPA: hypothetical protein VE736_03110 [Gaiellaceae bacterium]|nr:hypothetical protein [Gaiellaceae bacterium]
MEQQLRRYFIGIVTFGFIVTWIAIGTVAAFLAVLGTVAAMTAVPALLDSQRRQHRGNRGRAHSRVRPRTITARTLVDERPDELPLVPDEPSLIIDVSG